MKNDLIRHTAGTPVKLASEGHFGFLIQPALPYSFAAAGITTVADGGPGRFPLEITFDDNRPAFGVGGPHLYSWPEPLPGFRITSGASGFYRVHLLERPGEFVALGHKVRRLVPLSDPSAVVAVSDSEPSAPTDGWAIPWGAVAWQAYFSAANQEVELWVRSETSAEGDSNWFLAETIDLAVVGQVVGREVLLGHAGAGDTPDRIAFRRTGVAVGVGIGVEVEL